MLRQFRRQLMLTTLLISGAALAPDAAADVLPSGGAFAAGTGNIGATAAKTTVSQSSDRGIVNWTNFSVAKGHSVDFQNGSGATLNRVTGNLPSDIGGTITATGSVFLINRQGVVIESTGRVVTGGSFVASTLDVDNVAFMGGGALRFTGSGGGSITNSGTILSNYGDALMIAPSVTNTGTMKAPNGTAGMAGGTDITIHSSDHPGERVFIQVAGSGTVTNTGTVAGAMAELQAAGGNVYALAGNNGGQIRATGVGVRDGKVWLTASGGSVINGGVVASTNADGKGGKVEVQASQLVSNTGTLSASGTTGGTLSVTAANVINQGTVSADGANSGGDVTITASASYLDSSGSRVSADGGLTKGGTVTITGDGTAFSSGTLSARSEDGQGGRIEVTPKSVSLIDAHLDASGGTGGGEIRVGGTDFHGGSGARSETVKVSETTTLKADATKSGAAGSVVVWSEKSTTFAGDISATGHTAAGSAEVSSAGIIGFGGKANLAAANGQRGTLLLDPKFITISDTVGALGTKLVDPREGVGANLFGTTILALASGNVVVTAPGDSAGGAGAGAVYVFNAATGALVSALTGSQSGDQVGATGVSGLTGGNFVIRSNAWNGNRGAVTFGSATTGVSGVVSSTNSLVGANANDLVGNGGITNSPAAGTSYIIRSSNWNGNMGAVTQGSNTTGVTGVVSSANSLVGSTAGDLVGSSGVGVISTGKFVILSPNWNGKRGAATLIDPTVGTSGAISAVNSLVGSLVNDQVGAAWTLLSNTNFIIRSSQWNGRIGAATWVDSSVGLTGAVSASNSLVGSVAGDQVGSGGTALTGNGNAVITSTNWSNRKGAATWINGTTGLTGVVSASNSLVGSATGDLIGTAATALSNGNVVLRSATWNGSMGAVTWANGTTGVTGTVSAANSLVGSTANDRVGSSITAIGGNVVIGSAGWSGGRGAATWIDGTAGVTGSVSATNSLVGSSVGDAIGGSVTALRNNDYVVQSSTWSGNLGSATYGSGTTGVVGAVSAANSLVGSTAGDQIGSNGIIALANGSYVVGSSGWNGNRGAATFGAAGTGVTGTVSVTNSLIGTTAGDKVGTVIVGAGNSSYMVGSSAWNGNRGAATYAATGGIAGEVSTTNSLTGVNAGDQIGTGIAALGTSNNFVVRSPNWNGGMGAVTQVTAAAGSSGTVSSANSLVGSTAGDQVGSSVTISGNTYIVGSTAWNGGRGAVTWAGGSTGITGVVSSANSLVGSTAGAALTYAGISGSFLYAKSATDGTSGRVYSYQAGAGPTTYAASPGDSSSITTATLTNLLLQGSNVSLQANSDITVASAITANGAGGSLTLAAGRSILVNANITVRGKAVSLVANDNNVAVVDAHRDPGAAVISMASGVKIDTGTAALTMDVRDGGTRTNTTRGDITVGGLTAGTVNIRNSGGGITFNDAVSSGNWLLATANGGDLKLNSGAALSAAGTGDAIRLATSGRFINNAGSQALAAANGRWLVFTSDLPNVSAGGLAASPLYGRAFNFTSRSGGTITNAGNRFVYGATKTLTVAADTKTVTYNGANQFDSYAISGLVNGDQASAAYAGAPLIAATKNAGTYNITPSRGTLTSDYGYTFAYTLGRLTIAPYALTYSIADTSSTYGTTATKGAVTLSAPFAGDVLNPVITVYNQANTAVTLGTRTAAGVYVQKVTSLGNNNYTVAASGNQVGAITIAKKELTWSVADASSTYGVAPRLGAATLTGVVAGDRLSATVGIFDGADKPVTVTARTAAGSYSERVTGVNSANYMLAASGNAPGTLTVAPRTISIRSIGPVLSVYGVPTKPATFAFNGLFAGDSLTGVVSLRDLQGRTVTLSPSLSPGRYRQIGVGLSGPAAGNYRLAATGNAEGVFDISVPRITSNPAIMPVVRVPLPVQPSDSVRALLRSAGNDNRDVPSLTLSDAEFASARLSSGLRRIEPGSLIESRFDTGRSRVIYQLPANAFPVRRDSLAQMTSFEEATLAPNASVLVVSPKDFSPAGSDQ